VSGNGGCRERETGERGGGESETTQASTISLKQFMTI
jgi:hypothetical protein